MESNKKGLFSAPAGASERETPTSNLTESTAYIKFPISPTLYLLFASDPVNMYFREKKVFCHLHCSL